MKVLAIYNPQSGSGKHEGICNMLMKKFGSDFSIARTDYPFHATEIAKSAAGKNIQTIVAIGGDGTVNEVLNGIISSNVSLGIIPTGTANDLASLYHLPTDVSAACNVIQSGNIQAMDVIQVNNRFYVTAGGFGFPCEVARVANAIKGYGALGQACGKVLGSLLYVLSFLIALTKRAEQHNSWTVRAEDLSINLDALWLMVDNQPSLGKNFLMSPGAINNDGLFDICLVKNPVSRTDIFSLVLKVTKGKHIGCAGVTTGRYRELMLCTDTPIPFFGDGQVFEKSSKFRIRIVPGALKLIVPKNSSNNATAPN